MITISLDEQGNFETVDKDNTNEPLFIAGLIYDYQFPDNDLSKEEREEQEEVEFGEEKKRIKSYYKKVISVAKKNAAEQYKAEFVYPTALHAKKGLNEDEQKDRDHKVVKLVKEQVSNTLPEFLEMGTYNREPLKDARGRILGTRKGTYHLFSILKSDKGKAKFLTPSAGKLANDDFAGNRYFHMASTVVNRLIFHDPLYTYQNMPTIDIDLASRVSRNVSLYDEEDAKEFKEGKYQNLNTDGNDKHNYYYIMNGDIYRTLIAQEMLTSGRTGIMINKFFVSSINYDEESEDKKKEFLYLADSICSILGYKLSGSSADEWLLQMDERLSHLNKNENMLFGYDEIDNYFAEAWNAYEKKDYFKALSVAYDGKKLAVEDSEHKKSVFAEYYRDHWFSKLEDNIVANIRANYFIANITELSAMLPVNNLEQDKLLYLMKMFERMIPTVEDDFQSNEMLGAVLYKLYDAGLAAFCHIGDSVEAEKCYKKCRQYADYVGVDAFLLTRNRLVVCYEDNFNWDEALRIATEDIEFQKKASALKSEIIGTSEGFTTIEEARSISQKARVLAEKKDSSAEALFREALEKFDRGSSLDVLPEADSKADALDVQHKNANYRITQSYLLHYYADMSIQEQFEKEATDYFHGKETYSDRLSFVIDLSTDPHAEYSKYYALYVLIRGLYLFGKDQLDGTMWTRLSKLPDKLNRVDHREVGGHPWELIYKYIELIAYDLKKTKKAEHFEALRTSCIRHTGSTIDALNLYGAAEIQDHIGEVKKRDEITEGLAQFMKEHFDKLKDVTFFDDGYSRFQQLGEYFTLMYH